jgi:tripartite-type tricarboxylate transporter receptor subunit TctC
MTTQPRRAFLTSAALGALSTMAPAAFAAPAWPSKPITFVVGFPPGGLTDAGARLLSTGLGTSLGYPAVVESKPGASGNLAVSDVLRSRDSHRMLVANTSITINPHTFPTPVPSPMEFTPVGLIFESSLVLCVNPASPAKTFDQFRAWVQSESKAGAFNYATADNGGITHLAMEYFRERAGLPAMTHVAYKGSGPAIRDVIGNQVPCVMDGASLLIPFIASGRLHPILVTSAARLPALPDVPTASELGLKDFAVSSFVGLWGAPRLELDIVRKMNAALNTAILSPAIANAITKNGDLVGGGSPERLAALTEHNFKLWGDIAKRNNIKAD